MRTTLAGIVLLSAMTVFSQEKRPNIIMIAVDDLNDWIGPYGGNPQVITPNLDIYISGGIEI